ncbi:MAG: HAD family hydrolase [Ignavibacteria bacterium]|jgi:putative hydrolase of the HAD superfamily
MNLLKECILFDLYGTLLELKVDESSDSFWEQLEKAFSEFNKSVTKENLKRIFQSTTQRSDLKEGFMMNTVFSEFLKELGLTNTKKNKLLIASIFRKISLTKLQKLEYVDDLFEILKKNKIKIGLVSNTEMLLTSYDLKATQLNDQFDCISLSSEVGVKKPNKEIFYHCINKLNTTVDSCIMIGDNFVEDIDGANAIGMDAIYVGDKKIVSPNKKIRFCKTSFSSIYHMLQECGYQL